MKKRTIGVISLSTFGLILGVLGVAIVPRAKSFNLRLNADVPYSCDLPDGYVEINTVVAKIYNEASSEAIDNPYNFRGTVTKRVGDMAFLQRVNQTTHFLEAIRVTGLNSYANEIEEGNVVDIYAGGRLFLSYNTPTVILNDNSQHYVAYSSNPYGYSPKVYSGPKDWWNYGRSADTYEDDNGYALSRYIKLNNCVPTFFTNEETVTFGDEAYYYGAFKDLLDENYAFNFVTSTDADNILTKIASAINDHKCISLSGIYYYHQYACILINSADDITITDTPSYDTNVISEVTSFDYVWGTGENQRATEELFHMVGKGDIPYVKVQDFINDRSGLILGDYNNRYVQMDSVDGHPYQTIFYSNTYGYFLVDAENDTITTQDYNGYLNNAANRVGGNEARYLVDGTTVFCSINETMSDRRIWGENQHTYDFGQFDIDIIQDRNGNMYAPINTLGNLIYTMDVNIPFIWNGNNYYYMFAVMQNDSLYQMFVNESAFTSSLYKSEEMGEYTYNDFLFALEYCYGLEDDRDLTTILQNDSELTDLIKSNNHDEYEEGLVKFVGKYLFDGHAQYYGLSPTAHTQEFADNVNTWYSNALSTNARYQQFVDVEGLNEQRDGPAEEDQGKGRGLAISGNTAIIRFDEFIKYRGTQSEVLDIVNNLDDYSYRDLHDMGSELLFRKAFNEIEDTPGIENVVIDLTLNGGGEIDVVPWLEAYLTSNPSLVMNFRVDGECTEIYYDVDINYDGVVNALDTYQGQYTFYCMNSKGSFSCGNYLPTILKTKNLATMIGDYSGGGVCAVGFFATATGTMIRNSSNNQLGVWDNLNDQFVCYENGIPYDHYFASEHFYDDAAIASFINSL